MCFRSVVVLQAVCGGLTCGAFLNGFFCPPCRAFSGVLPGFPEQKGTVAPEAAQGLLS